MRVCARCADSDARPMMRACSTLLSACTCSPRNRSIRAAGHYTGLFPIDDNASWEKNAASVKQLHRLRERLRVLEQVLAQTNKNISAP